jgi:hypothetical protein
MLLPCCFNLLHIFHNGLHTAGEARNLASGLRPGQSHSPGIADFEHLAIPIASSSLPPDTGEGLGQGWRKVL